MEDRDVFVSWRGVDRDFKDRAVFALREAGFTVWESDEDCLSNVSECLEAISTCEVFVIIISDATMEDSYVDNELTKAHELSQQGKLNMVVYRLTDAPMGARMETHLNNVPDVNRLNRQRHGAPEDGLDALVTRVGMLLERRRAGDPVRPNDVLEPKITGVRLRKPGYFVPGSRDRELEALDQALAQSDTVILTSPLPGYGRTSMMREYARKVLEEKRYEEVIFLEGFRGSLDQVISFVGFDNINPEAFQNLEPERLRRRKGELLHRVGKDTLVVVPQVLCGPVTEHLRQFWTDPGCKFVILSRDKAEDWAPWFPVLEVGAMEPEHQRELFCHICGAAEEEPVARFLQDIEGHTRTIEITALALRREKGELSRFLEGFRDGDLEDRVAHHLSVAFQMENFTPAQRQLLQVAALVAEPPLETEVFLDLLRRCHLSGDHRNMIQALAEDRWLNLSEDGKWVHTEPLLRKAYLAEQPHPKLVERCADAICRMYKTFFMDHSPGRLMSAMERMLSFLEQLGATEAARLMEFCCSMGEGRVRPGSATIREVEDLCQQIRRRYEEDGRKMQKENPALYQLYGVICSMVEPLLATFIPKGFGSRGQVVVETPTVWMGVLPALKRILDPNRDWALQNCIYDATAACVERNPGWMHQSRQQLMERLAVTKNKMLLKEAYCALANVTFYMVMEYTEAGLYYGALDLIRETFAFPGIMEQIPPVYMFYIRSTAIDLLWKLMRFDDEMFEHFEYIVDHYAEICADVPAGAQMSRSKYLRNWISAQIRAETLSDARRTLARFGRDDRVEDWICCCQDVTDALLKVGRFREAREVLQMMKASPLYAQGREEPELQDLMAVLRAMESPQVPELFGDGNETYQSYYDTYLPEDRRKLPGKYAAMAQKAQEYDLSSLTDQQLLERAEKLRTRAKMGAAAKALMAEAFALVSEAGIRVLGYRHHYVQYLGGAVMAEGQIAEIFNGEGKTYTILLPAFLHSLFGKTVWILDESPYLTGRNYRWMAGVLRQLGIPVQLMLESSKELPAPGTVCYATLKAAGMMQMNSRTYQRFQSEKDIWGVAIVDEADNDMMLHCGEFTMVHREGYLDRDSFIRVCDLALWMHREKHCSLPRSGFPQFDKVGMERIEALAKILRTSDIQQVQWQVGFALLGLVYHRRNVDYFIRDGRVWQEDPFTGGLKNVRTEYEVAVCLRERIPIRNKIFEQVKLIDRTTMREFLGGFQLVCGTTATASEHRKFFESFYGLMVWAIPPNIPVMRKNHLARFFGNEEAKNQAIGELVAELHETGRPVLIVAEKVGQAELLCEALRKAKVPFEKLDVRNDGEKAERLARAGMKGSVLVANAMVNRGVDIRLGGDPWWMARQELLEAGYPEELLDDAIYGPLDQDEQHRKLRQRYQSRAATLHAQLRRSREELEGLGGLCVIGSCCFKDLRIEQQVRGRAGRQGVPGETWMFYSAEDEVLYSIMGERIRVFAAMIEDDYIQVGGQLKRAIYSARVKRRDRLFDQVKEEITWEDCLVRSRQRLLELTEHYRAMPPEQRYDAFMKEARRTECFRGSEQPWEIALRRDLDRGEKKGLEAFARATNRDAQELLQMNKVAFDRMIGVGMADYWCKAMGQIVQLREKCKADTRLGVRNFASELSVLTDRVGFGAISRVLARVAPADRQVIARTK